MGLFKRRPTEPADNPIAAFWRWWEDEGRSLAEQSIAGQLDPEDFARTMAARVRPLGELGWELAPGETSAHVLVLTPEGDAAARALARRVVLAAPEADVGWSYVDTRPAAVDLDSMVLSVPGAPEIALSRVQVSARVNGTRFDVQVHHPAFADLPKDTRTQVAFLALDAALGEIDVELWVGEVQPVEFSPMDGFGLTALRSVVRDHRSKHLDADGQPHWAMLRGETASGPLLAMVQSPLHPLTAPNLDTYVQVVLPYANRTESGLPDGGSLQSLRSFEERLERALGASGRVVAHLSTAGSRTLHVYVDSTTGALATVKELAGSWAEGTAVVHDMHDPEWAAVTHLRT